MNTVFLSMDSNFIELLKRVNHATPIIAIIPSYTGGNTPFNGSCNLLFLRSWALHRDLH